MGHLPPWLVVWMMALTPPAGLALEYALRRVLFPPGFEELRAYLAPHLTPVAWVLAGLVPVMGLVARPVERRVAGWWRRRHPGDGNAGLAGLYLAASLPQLAALGATTLFTFGAALVPVAVAVGVATAVVLVLGYAGMAAPRAQGGSNE